MPIGILRMNLTAFLRFALLIFLYRNYRNCEKMHGFDGGRRARTATSFARARIDPARATTF
jgi:hypothetical protein